MTNQPAIERRWQALLPTQEDHEMTPRFNPIPHVHPPALLRLVEALGPPRPGTMWDKTVERSLNGLRAPHLYLGRALADRVPWLLLRELLTAHAHFLGGSRSGKTSLGLISLIAQLIAYADSSVVVIDLTCSSTASFGATNLWRRWDFSS